MIFHKNETEKIELVARPAPAAIGATSSVSISADVLVTRLPPLPDEELLPPMEPGLATLWPRMVGDEGVEGAVRVLSEKVVTHTDSCALLLCLFHKRVYLSEFPRCKMK